MAAAGTLVAQTAQLHLRNVVSVSAENGTIAVNDDVMSFFSSGDIFLKSPTDQRWHLAEKNFGAVSLKLGDTKWQQIKDPLPISTASDFALCDPLNQIDIHMTDTTVQSLLPAGAKIKRIATVSPGIYVVVYSTSADKVSYDIRIALMKYGSTDKKSLIKSVLASDAGNFCSFQWQRTTSSQYLSINRAGVAIIVQCMSIG